MQPNNRREDTHKHGRRTHTHHQAHTHTRTHKVHLHTRGGCTSDMRHIHKETRCSCHHNANNAPSFACRPVHTHAYAHTHKCSSWACVTGTRAVVGGKHKGKGFETAQHCHCLPQTETTPAKSQSLTYRLYRVPCLSCGNAPASAPVVVQRSSRATCVCGRTLQPYHTNALYSPVSPYNSTHRGAGDVDCLAGFIICCLLWSSLPTTKAKGNQTRGEVCCSNVTGLHIVSRLTCVRVCGGRLPMWGKESSLAGTTHTPPRSLPQPCLNAWIHALHDTYAGC